MANWVLSPSFEKATIPAPLEQSHFIGLDGLRGVSIIIVIMSHLFLDTPYASSFSGDIGVEIFFVISGFLITSLLIKEKIKTGRISLRNFFIRRFLRIVPVAYLYLFILMALNYYLSLGIRTPAFLSATFFLQNIPHVSTFNWYVAHFWSLSVEEQFYWTFPFLLVYDIGKYSKVIITLIVIVPLVGILGYGKVGIFYSNAIVHFAAFGIINLIGKTVCILIGSLASICLFKKIIVLPKSSPKYLSLIIFGVAISIHTETSPISLPFCGLHLFPVLIAAVIVLNLDARSLLTKILGWKVLRYIGLISYSLYIWQQLFTKQDQRIVKVDSIFIQLVILFAVANISYFFFEKRFIKLKEKFTK